MPLTVADALASARTFLNDDMAFKWTDSLLMPKLVQAYGELGAKLQLNGIAVVREQSSTFTVTAGSLDLGINIPTDIIDIIALKEYPATGTLSEAVDMVKREFPPTVEQSETLRYWTYREQTIIFVGATTDRKVIVYYIKDLAVPTDVTSVLEFKKAEIFLGPRVAAIVATSIKDGQLAEELNRVAETNLSTVVRAQVKGDQKLPVRRRPFSSRFRKSRNII